MGKYSEKAIDTYFGDRVNSGNKKGKESYREPIYNLKVSEEKKYDDDGQWFKDYAEYIVPAHDSSIENYKKMKMSYEILNNDLSSFKEEVEKFVNPLGEDFGFITEDLKPYPILHNKVNVLKGDLLARAEEHRVILMSAKAIREKNEELLNAIRNSVEEKLALEIDKVEMQLQDKSQDEIDQYIEEMRSQLEPEDIASKNFTSELEIFYNHALKYCYHDQDVKLKQSETIEDTITADRCFVYSGWRFGKPYVEVRNTLFSGFHKAPNEPFVHKGDYFFYKKAITVADAYNVYGNLLSDDELYELGMTDYTRNTKVDKRHDIFDKDNSERVFDHTTEELFLAADRDGDFDDKRVGTHQGQGLSTRRDNERLIWETHIEFKAFRKVIFLTYTDDYNKEITTIVPDDYNIPDDAEIIEFTNRFGDKSEKKQWVENGTRYAAETLWIPRKYEVIRLGNDIYPIYREVPHQHTSPYRPYSKFELSTKGAIFTSRNAESVSLLQRALPAYFQYMYVKKLLDREFSKYHSYIQDIDVDQIPDDLGKDEHGEVIRDKVKAYLYYLKKTNKSFYSGTQGSMGGLPPSQRSPGSNAFTLGAAAELLNLQNIVELLGREVGIAMGISPQREAQIQDYTTAADNARAMAQSYSITEPYFFLHSKVWESALNDYLRNFHTYCKRMFEDNPEKKEHYFQYVLPNGTQELFKVTPDHLRHEDFGLVLNSRNRQYSEAMMQLSGQLAQNAGEGLESMSALIKAITSDSSPEEIHKMISVEADKQQKRMNEAKQQELKAQERAIRMQVEAREDIQAHEIEKIVVKELENRETRLKEAAIKAMGFDPEKDYDDDNIPDVVELAKLNQEGELEKRKLDLKEKEIETKKELEEKKIKSNEKITNIKKNSDSV